MKKWIGALVLAGAVAGAAAPATAQHGNFGVRLRALHMAVDSDTSPDLNVDVEDRWIPAVDFSYRLTENFALELVLTYPQKHDVSLAGTPIGSVKHLPPTLLLQYHLLPQQAFQPYVGVGVNYTRFSDVRLADGAIRMEKDSTGLALQAGFDYRVSKSLYLNFDVKKIDIDADLYAGGARATSLKLDPWLVGVGVGWRF